jgi:hypothetical protein
MAQRRMNATPRLQTHSLSDLGYKLTIYTAHAVDEEITIPKMWCGYSKGIRGGADVSKSLISCVMASGGAIPIQPTGILTSRLHLRKV